VDRDSCDLDGLPGVAPGSEAPPGQGVPDGRWRAPQPPGDGPHRNAVLMELSDDLLGILGELWSCHEESYRASRSPCQASGGSILRRRLVRTLSKPTLSYMFRRRPCRKMPTCR